ncbi:MAG: hypothetical protein ACYDD6_03695, partial [Acidimicrobiales bacterium]
SSRSKAIATRQGVPCGYSRQVGSGTAQLLGSWLAASSVPGRAGVVLDEQQAPPAPADTSSLDTARSLAEKYFGTQAAAALPPSLPEGAAEFYIVYAYTNQRRGGSYFVAGGALAYWNGDQVVGLLQLTTAVSGAAQAVEQIPFRPPDAAHVAVAQALAGVSPQVQVTDLRIQARVLDAPGGTTSTVVANNRWSVDVPVVLSTVVGGAPVRLPASGEYTIPANTGLLLPVGYPVGNGVTVAQATAQLTGASVSGSTVTLEVWAPAPGEVIVVLPAPLAAASLDGRPVATTSGAGGTVRVAVPKGDHTITLTW